MDIKKGSNQKERQIPWGNNGAMLSTQALTLNNQVVRLRHCEDFAQFAFFGAARISSVVDQLFDGFGKALSVDGGKLKLVNSDEPPSHHLNRAILACKADPSDAVAAKIIVGWCAAAYSAVMAKEPTLWTDERKEDFIVPEFVVRVACRSAFVSVDSWDRYEQAMLEFAAALKPSAILEANPPVLDVSHHSILLPYLGQMYPAFDEISNIATAALKWHADVNISKEAAVLLLSPNHSMTWRDSGSHLTTLFERQVADKVPREFTQDMIKTQDGAFRAQKTTWLDGSVNYVFRPLETRSKTLPLDMLMSPPQLNP